MSDKPIAERLQFKKDRRLAVVGATPECDAALGASDRRADPADANVIVVFLRDCAGLRPN